MADVKGYQAIDYMARDYDSLLRAMRERIPELLPEWAEYTSEADFGNVLLEAFAYMGDILSYYQDRIAGESFLGTAQSRRSVIQHLRLIGYNLRTAAPAAAQLTLLLPKSCRDIVTIKKGDAFATKSQRDGSSVRFEYAGDVTLTIDAATLDLTTDRATNRMYRFCGIDPFDNSKNPRLSGFSIPVEEGRLIANERLGISDESPDQRFPLAHPRLILRPPSQALADSNDLVLQVEDGQSVKRWNLRETLAFSRPGDLLGQQETVPQPDFAVEIDENDRAVIIFGDGKFGRIPPKGALIKASYRVGGGAQGNVPADSITTITNAPVLALAGAIVTNPAPATGGADRESVAHAVTLAPTVFRSRKRAVTKEDYERLALNYQGVGKVRAETTGWNTVTLYVAPAGGGSVSDTLCAGLLAYFEDKRPITTRVEIADVTYVKIMVAAEIGVERYYSEQLTGERIRAAVQGLLQFDAVDFGRTLYLSKFYEAVEAIEGVSFVAITRFRREDGTSELENRVKLEPHEIAVPGRHDWIEVRIVPPQGEA